ncbi:hypothetical protein BEP19_01230 [Ammoniphilus oxalaticus]|uniref:YkoP-like domain-containing protein n=2 Tax=Ammoniphilus oxalaticus TaxID=66863 RepID=A0A419SP82_9BACL|nr:hypothetical protein BEP19_01230 [Ammoniphilus oxalaticus]
MILPIWGLIDQVYYHCNRLQFVDRLEDNIFRVRITRYRGYPLQLRDGTKIEKGDLLVKIHLHNYSLVKKMRHLKSDVRRALFVYEAVKQSLPGLANYLKGHPLESQVKGILGVTVLNRGVRRLGFDTFNLKHPLYSAWKKSYMVPLTAICHGDFNQIFTGKYEPKYLVMGKETLFDLYSDKSMGEK